MKCKITDVCTFSKGVLPVLGDFEQGPIPKKMSLEHPCSVQVNDRTKQQIVVVKRKENYLTGYSDSNEMCQTFILVRNKRTNEGKLVPVNSCYFTKPEAKKRQSSETVPLEKTKAEKTKDFLSLTKTFGSKRSQRQSDIGVRMALNSMGNVDEVSEIVKDVDVGEEDLKDSTEDVNEILKILPPCNRDATSIEAVYQLDNFLTENELKSLESTAHIVMEEGLTDKDEKENYFLGQFLKKTKENLQQTQILLYANCIRKFLGFSVKDIKTKNFPSLICSYSLPISKKIIREFTVESKSGRQRPMYMKDKAICYLIALILLISNYTVDLELLSSALKGVSQKKLKLLMKTIGVVPASGGKHVLKVPLPPLPTAPKMKK